MQNMLTRYASLFFVAAILIAPSPPQTTQGDQAHHGIPILGPIDRPAPLPEPLAKAWSDALWLAQEHADELGYPWVDRANARLAVGVVKPTGSAVVAKWVANGLQKSGNKPLTLPAPQVPVDIRTVRFSWTQLEAIKIDAIFLVNAGVPDADLIHETAPDYERNRVIITVDRLSDRLSTSLAQRYGTEAIALRVTRRVPSNPDRHADVSGAVGFWGGAKINAPAGGASSGFPWMDSSTTYMVSAGHAAPAGGSVSTPAQFMGSVTPGSRENWTANSGTTLMTGQTEYRGDISLIQITNGFAGSSIYVGSASSESSATVKEMWYRSPAPGDQYCTGGSTTGEICGFSVEQVRIVKRYDNGETIINATKGTKGGTCNAGGDSGGPVYTVRGDGGIAAKGIHSGGGFVIATCFEYFTDIWDAYYGFPGWLKIG